MIKLCDFQCSGGLRPCFSSSHIHDLLQVHPVINLVHDFDPQANLPLGHLALFNVRSALRAASHANLPPVPPNAAPNHNWSTLTFPSPITSDDGRGGRSFPVGIGIPGVASGLGEQTPPGLSPSVSPAVSFPALPQTNIPGTSLTASQVTPSQDIDLQLLQGTGVHRTAKASGSEPNGTYAAAAPNQVDGSTAADELNASAS